MDSKRDRITKLISYIESQGVEVNISKTKARGNRGFFFVKNSKFRIDVSKKINEEEILSVLLHEFAHFIHYKHDKNLNFPEFIFRKNKEKIEEELIKITVNSVEKSFAESLFNAKNTLKQEITELNNKIKTTYPNFKVTSPFKQIEASFPLPAKYLLKYDKIKYLGNIYSIDNISNYFDLSNTDLLYINLKIKQRALKRINSKISRINKYYNNPTELFARFIENYYIKNEKTVKSAPLAVDTYLNYINTNINSEFFMLNKIITSI